MSDPLEPLRRQIDDLDRQIVDLLNARAHVVVEVGKVKQERNLSIYAPDREKIVFEKVRGLNKGPLPNRCLEAVYRELMSGSFALERPLRIGYLGPAGSFSHEASTVEVRQPASTTTPLADIPAVFDEVVRGHIDYGLVPVENIPCGGGVVDTLDAFLGSSARVCAEVLVTIHHNVLCSGPWENVKTVLSKDAVFAQCRKWLSGTAKGLDVRAVESTSRAAEIAKDDPTVAAIASRHAAELYGLTMLFENIEDNPDNVTRFFVISREHAKRTGEDKTAIMFTTAHKPGALAEVLDVFRDKGLNLTDIEKRPSQKTNWEYYFFIDAMGHADDAEMKAAIAEAGKHCLQMTVLGSYPRAVEVL